MGTCEYREGEGEDAICMVIRNLAGTRNFGCAYPLVDISRCPVIVCTGVVSILNEEGIIPDREVTRAVRTAVNGLQRVRDRNGTLVDGSL